MPFTKESASLGGIKGGATGAGARKNREISFLKYYRNPNICKQCGSIIHIKDKMRASDARRKTFCNHSCSAKYNNLGIQRNPPKSPVIKCENCKSETRNKRFCSNICRLSSQRTFIESLGSLSKKELFSRRANYHSARGAIVKHANLIYKGSNKTYICISCGYSLSVQIAHLKSVASFLDDVLISKINNINNLVAMCRNCHWEYDNGHLQLDSKHLEDKNG